MHILPHTLSLITTHQCTAACDHCCFSCTPRVTASIPVERLHSLIDEARDVASLRVIVFTGGECFLLGKDLDQLVSRAKAHGFTTRCVTNGYWATSRQAAERRLSSLRRAGLDEINFSTGEFHSNYVPLERIQFGAVAAVELGLTTLITAEVSNETTLDLSPLLDDRRIADFIGSGRLLYQRNVWIANAEGAGESKLSHPPEYSRFSGANRTGCKTVLDVIAVTPSQSLVSCCGLHLESIPELHLGSVSKDNIRDVIAQEPDDLLKIWLHTQGPEAIMEFAATIDDTLELPLDSVHPCTTCLHLYRDPRVRTILMRHVEAIQEGILEDWMSELAVRAASALPPRIGNEGQPLERRKHRLPLME